MAEQQHQRHTHPETVAVPEARGEHRGTELDVRRDAKLHRAVDEVTTDLRGAAERRRPCHRGETKSGANLATLPSDRNPNLLLIHTSKALSPLHVFLRGRMEVRTALDTGDKHTGPPATSN